MKKVDFHIHTIRTISDSANFIFNESRLIEYIKECQLDAVAITNHNVFDMHQYEELQEHIAIKVFPGIEINIGENSSGHLIVISEVEQVIKFQVCCEKVTELIHSATDFITYDQFLEIFSSSLDNILLIPHFAKEPHVDKDIVKKLSDYIFCGEVSNVKKFVYYSRTKEITPVIFSDFRPVEGAALPIRQTYLDIENVSLSSIKHCLFDSTKVSLSPDSGNELFEALPGLYLSTGLNVVMGARSSGKTHTLDLLAREYPNCKYIRQFSLLETDQDKAEKDFESRLAAKQSVITEKYFEEFRGIVNQIKDISLKNDDLQIEDYVSSLISNAEEINRADAFAKCSLYLESPYSLRELSTLKKLIAAVETLLATNEYQEIISAHINREELVSLYKDLIIRYRKEWLIRKKKEWINGVLEKIRNALQQRSAQTNIKDCDFYSIALDKVKVKKFSELVKLIKEPKVIYSEETGGFITQVKKSPFTRASEMKNLSHSKMGFADCFSVYDGDPYDFLQELRKIDGLEESTYYKYFVNVQHALLNEFLLEVSGGERAEYNLIQELNDAKQHEMLLIDEPESSFDNVFLKTRINQIIKDISKIMPVVLVTHNNTVGASILPNYLIYTVRKVDEKRIPVFQIYSGRPEEKYLVNADGEKIENIRATLDCLEAGETAYDERRKEYEMLKNL